jgi:hypothetical protein
LGLPYPDNKLHLQPKEKLKKSFFCFGNFLKILQGLLSPNFDAFSIFFLRENKFLRINLLLALCKN